MKYRLFFFLCALATVLSSQEVSRAQHRGILMREILDEALLGAGLPYCFQPGYQPFPAGPSVGVLAGVFNAGNNFPTALAPGAWIRIQGMQFTYNPSQTATPDPTETVVPTILGGTEVLVNGEPAPISNIGLLLVSNPEIAPLSAPPFFSVMTAQVPYDVDTSKPAVVQLRMTMPDGTRCATPALEVATSKATPAVFVKNGGPVFVRQDGYGSVWLNGLGTPTNLFAGVPLVSSVQIDPPLVKVSIDGNPATAQFVGLIPGMSGVYQVNFPLPEGKHTVQLSVSGQALQWTSGAKLVDVFTVQ